MFWQDGLSPRGRAIVPAVFAILFLTGVIGCSGGGDGGSSSVPVHYFVGKTYGGAGQDIGVSVTQTNDGGYLAIGFTNSGTAGDYDVLLVRTDSGGKSIRKIQFGGPGDDYGLSVVQTSDSGFALTGVYNCSVVTCNYFWPSWPIGYPQDVVGRLFLRKLDANLDFQWETLVDQATYGNSDYLYAMGYSVAQTADGGYIVGGATAYNPGGATGLLVKTDNSGNIQWATPVGGKGVSGVRQTPEGGYVISIAGAGGATGDVIAKIDVGGKVTWQTVLHGSSQAVWNTGAGDYVVTGVNPLPMESGNLYLGKISGAGAIIWEKAFGGTGGDEGLSVQEASDHGYIATGWGGKLYDNTAGNVYLVKTDGNGALQWEKSYGGMKSDAGRAVRQTADGGYIVTGFTDSAGAGGYDLFLLKIDASGNSQW